MSVYVCILLKLPQPYPVIYAVANPGRGRKDVRRSQRVVSWGHPLLLKAAGIQIATKILARSNHPRTSETYPRQGDVFGYYKNTVITTELQLSGVLPVFQNLNYKLEKTA